MKKTMKEIRDRIDFWKKKAEEHMPNGLKCAVEYVGFEAVEALNTKKETMENMLQIELAIVAKKKSFECQQLLRKINSIIVEESGLSTIEAIERIKFNQKLISDFGYFNKKKKKNTSLNAQGITVTKEFLYEPLTIAEKIESLEKENRFLQSVIDKSNLLLELELSETEAILFYD